MAEKSIIALALSESAKVARNEESSKFFVTKKDTAYVVNNLPMVMKAMEKHCGKLLSAIVDRNGKKPLTANQVTKVIVAVFNDDRVLDIIKAI